MAHLFSSLERPLPEALLADLQELLTWRQHSYLTWTSVDAQGGPDGSRWFTVRLTSDGRSHGLRLEFWIPRWMQERGVAAILPASLSVADCRPGVSAEVDLGMLPLPELQAGLPRVARTLARLINELWGPTQTEGVLLLAVDYQPDLLKAAGDEPPGCEW